MRRSKKRRRRTVLYLASVFFFTVCVFTGIQRWIRPTVETRLVYQAKTYAVAALEETVRQELEQMDLSYGRLVRVSREEGRVVSLETDTVLLNQIKSRITQAAVRKMEKLSDYRLTVPLGSVSGIDLFSGKGPKVRFLLQPQTAVESQILQQFHSAGVNQTQHRIYLQLNVEIEAVIPGFSAKTSVQTQVELAQTVIVGEVPQFYAS
ncbi:MAG: sporulation protein YunB [Oscillospiraceae bacterium]|nr:sporulation protein YunB [Oscillospiraceae bacterium]